MNVCYINTIRACLGICLFALLICSAESSPDLIAAIRAGDRSQVEESLGDSNELAARDEQGNTPLHWAALAGDERLVQRLLDLGLAADLQNNAGARPLHYGAGVPRIVEMLLKAGADANAKSAYGSTPLHAAISYPGPESYQSTKLLLDAGADIDVKRKLHLAPPRSPLGIAITEGNERTAELLLERGADLAGIRGETAVTMAVNLGREELLKELLRRGAPVNFDNDFTGNALNELLYAGHTHLVDSLIDHQVDVNQAGTFGEQVPPIVFAAYNETGDPSAAKSILAKGADINAKTSAGHTALDWALRRGETPLTTYLRSQGAKSSIAAKQKRIPNNPIPSAPVQRESDVREAIQNAIDLLQSSSDGFLDNAFVKKSNCVSCHQQTLPAVGFGRALERGFRLDESSLARQLHAQYDAWIETAAPAYEMATPQPDSPTTVGYGLFGLKGLGYTSDGLTEALVWNLAKMQYPDGSFASYDRRPPMEEGQIIGTALAVGSLRLYPQPLKTVDLKQTFAKALAWFRKAKPIDANQEVFRLLGMKWSGAHKDELTPVADKILSTQREDGGWAPLPGIASDAWATGLTLFALHEAGDIKPNHTAYRRGTDFLLRTQFSDGSWWVPSRTWPFQPHFESGFPHGKDQWISAAGTAWAVLALLNELEPTVARENIPSAQMLMAKYPRERVDREKPALEGKKELTLDAVAGSQFLREIRPILEASCTECHSGEKPKGEFRLDSFAGLIKGGQSGESAIILGDPDGSLLIRYVTDQVEDLEMPPLERRSKYPALNSEQITRLKSWISAEAP